MKGSQLLPYLIRITLLSLVFFFSPHAQAQENNRILINTSSPVKGRVMDSIRIAPNNSAIQYSVQSTTLGYRGSREGYYKSTSGGVQWEEIYIPEEIKKDYSFCTYFIINPIDSNEVLCRPDKYHIKMGVLRGDRVIKSSDAGKTWTWFNKKEQGQPEIDIISYANDGKALYITQQLQGAGFGYRLLKKYVRESGVWKDKSSSLDQIGQGEVISIVVSPSNPEVIYMIKIIDGSTSVYKSNDAGSSWRKKIGAINNPSTLWLKIHPNYPDRLLFVDGGTAFLTDDGGNSWQKLSFPFYRDDHMKAKITSLVFNPKNKEGLFLWLYPSRDSDLNVVRGLYETRSLGNKWQRVKANVMSETSFPLIFQVIENDVFIGGYKLANESYSFEANDCLFNWAEQQYPTLFSPALAKLQTGEGYRYRYYADTNTYLGFFQDNEVHYLEANKSTEIENAGFMEQYIHLSGCDS